MTGGSLLELFIPDEEKCLDFFRCTRWADGVYCPECKSFDVYRRGFTVNKKIKRYSCNNCGKNFTDFTGTIFSNMHLPLGEMFYIIVNQDKKSTKRLAKELGHKWESVYRISMRFKEFLTKKAGDPVLSGEIEFDEMYQSAGSKGLKKTSQKKRA